MSGIAALTGPASYVATNILSAVALILFNKRVVVTDKFKFMTVLTAFHFYFSFIVCSLLTLFGLLRYKAVNNYFHLARIALGSLASIISMNFNLAYNSVGFYQISKISCIPSTLLLESMLGRRQQNLTLKMTSSLAFICIGMGLVAVNETSFSFIGFIWAAAGVISTSLAQIYFAPLQKHLGLNAMQMLFHLSPWMTFGSFISVPLFENVDELWAAKITKGLVTDIAISCCMAIILNITNYLVLSWASPLTYQVIGHVKTIIILLAGAVQYDSIPQGKTRIGMILAILGVIIYTEENRQQQIQQSRNLAPTSGNSSSASSTRFNTIDIDDAIDKVSEHVQTQMHHQTHTHSGTNRGENHDREKWTDRKEAMHTRKEDNPV